MLLRRDGWNDYNYKTTFTAEYRDGKEVFELGTVKILRKAQELGYTELPGLTFESLRGNYCSLGQTVSYYERLSELGRDIYVPILTGLCDVTYNPEIYKSFRKSPGFQLSLERHGSAILAIERSAQIFAVDMMNYQSAESRRVDLAFFSSVGGSQFTTRLVFNDSRHLPDRINAVIGYNGTGKTRLLANLAMVAHADLTKRKEDQFCRDYGQFIDHGDFRFGAVITVSYSAFDTFELPGGNKAEKERLRRVGTVFGHVYIGLRRFGAPLASATPTDDSHGLKSIREIEAEFFNALKRASDSVRGKLLDRALVPISQEPSFERLGVDPRRLNNPTFKNVIYPTLSTGHKIILNIIAQLAAYLEPRSLVLIDEPEVHLHPPLLAALMRSVNVLLTARDSYAVIATHSPVVLQEVPSKYVRVLRRFGNRTVVHDSEIETFGESVGGLTRYVFNLDSSNTDHHSVLKELAETLTMEEINELFDGRMSSQARSYVASLIRARAV